MSSVTFRSFAGGEIAPALWARTDQTKYATGLRTCRNFLVRREGGVTNRPGTVYVVETKASGVVRLVKFVFSDSQTYVLEFGDRYIRFVQDGGQLVASGTAWITATAYAVGDLVSSGGVTYYATVAHTSGGTTEPGVGASWQTDWYALASSVYEIPTPYLVADLAAIQYVQSADVMTLVHPSYPPAELRRYSHTKWILTTIAIGPEITAPAGLGTTGGVAGVDTYYAVTSVSEATGEESLAATITYVAFVPDAATPVVVTWEPVTGAIEYNVYRSTDGTTFGFIGTGGGTPTVVSDTTWTTTTSVVNSGADDVWIAAITQARNPVVATVADKAYNGQYRATGTIDFLVSGGTVPDTFVRVRAYYKRNTDAVRVDAGIIFDASMSDEGGATIPFTNRPVTVPDDGYTTLEIDLVAEVSIHNGGSAAITLTATRIDVSRILTQFSDTNVVPDYIQSPPTQPTLFATIGAYPSAVGYYQQRRLFANTTLLPEKVWASATGLPKNFTLSFPILDSDSLSWTQAGNRVNAVRHLLDLGKLIVFTASGEWTIEGDTAGILRPAEINPRQYSYAGSKQTLQPVVVVDTALFVQALGSAVRDLTPTSGGGGYTGNDLTLFAAHLFDGYTLVDWDYAQIPHSIVWVVRSDGTVLGLTYIKEQDVWGWHRHDTDGVVENVCSIPEGPEHRVYFVVRRTINGVTKRYIERLASRSVSDITAAIFVDCALSYDGRNTGVETMMLSGGIAWTYDELLTITRSVGSFTAGDVGNSIFLTADDDTQLRFALENYTSPTVMTGTANRTVPADLRSVATTDWSRAVDSVAGLSHLEGKAVSVTADGFVVANPNNEAYTEVAVSGGVATLDDAYAVIHVGLPYLSDLQTLDIDSASGPSTKDRKKVITKVSMMVESTRGLFAGTVPPTDDNVDPIENLYEPPLRELEDYDDPTALLTGDVELAVDGTWGKGGRIFVRQVDPLPCTILSATPQGFIPPVN